MSTLINTPKPCRHCGKLMYPSEYKNPAAFRITKHCSNRCGGMQRKQGVGDWHRLMAYRVKDGDTKTLEEIAEIVGVTRERVRQIEEAALRKIRLSLAGKRLREFE